MALVTLADVTKTYGPVVVLEGVNLELQPNEHVGLVGPNGAGKTTIFKLIVGLEAPDIGTVARRRGLRIGYLPQVPELDADAPLAEEVGRSFDHLHRLERQLEQISTRMAERHDSPDLPHLLAQYDRLRVRFETAGGYSYRTRIQEVLGGLGFAPSEFTKPVSALSGGQKCRAALAKLLLQEADLLLLDEPTNHLDLDATRWLEKFLASYRGAVVVVSHDRYLLDRVTSKTIELENRRVCVYPGGYSRYVEAKRVRMLTIERTYQKQQAFLRHEREFIDKYIAGQRGKQARGRRTRLERMAKQGQLLEQPAAHRETITPQFAAPERGGDMVLRCEHACKRYGSTVLFEDLNLELQRGEKVGIIGPNGAGKTTLLKMAIGQVAPDSGTVRLYPDLSVGYYDQEHADLDRRKSVIELVRAVRPDATTQQARSFLARFGFHGDDVFKPVGQLSGGEQSRVVLARLVWSNPQFLVLDEPTNHLDIPSREALEQALIDFPGTILLVSHDRYLLDKVVHKLVVLDRGRYEIHAGSYSEYIRKLEEQSARGVPAGQRPAKAAPNKKPKRPTARQPQPQPARSPYEHLSLDELEALIIEKEERLAELERQFADEGLYRNGDRARQVREEYRNLQAELDELNVAWQNRAE